MLFAHGVVEGQRVYEMYFLSPAHCGGIASSEQRQA